MVKKRELSLRRPFNWRMSCFRSGWQDGFFCFSGDPCESRRDTRDDDGVDPGYSGVCVHTQL
jgi:hypothetical protein